MDKLSPAELNERLSIALGIEPEVTWGIATGVEGIGDQDLSREDAINDLRWLKRYKPDSLKATNGVVESRKIYPDLQGTWQGMGEVIEAMAKRGWEFEVWGRQWQWTAEFSDLRGGRGVLAEDGDTAPRAVALAALSALTQEAG